MRNEKRYVTTLLFVLLMSATAFADSYIDPVDGPNPPLSTPVTFKFENCQIEKRGKDLICGTHWVAKNYFEGADFMFSKSGNEGLSERAAKQMYDYLTDEVYNNLDRYFLGQDAEIKILTNNRVLFCTFLIPGLRDEEGQEAALDLSRTTQLNNGSVSDPEDSRTAILLTPSHREGTYNVEVLYDGNGCHYMSSGLLNP